MKITREQAHEMVRQWCAPHLWRERHKDVDALFDFEEAQHRLREQERKDADTDTVPIASAARQA